MTIYSFLFKENMLYYKYKLFLCIIGGNIMKTAADKVEKIFERNESLKIRFGGIGEKPKKLEVILIIESPDITIQELSGLVCLILNRLRKHKKKIEFIILCPTSKGFVYETKSLTISKKTSVYKVLERLVEMINDEHVSDENELLDKAGETVSAIFE